MKFTRIYADNAGESHFADIELPLTLNVPATGLRATETSPAIATKHVQFLIAPPAAAARDWHPSPARQFALFLKGGLEVDVSDGSSRRFEQGSLLFLEDTWGKGHRTRAVSDEDILWVFIPVLHEFSIRNLTEPA
jgi:quercetin dioxygenase-like cupin family protein